MSLRSTGSKRFSVSDVNGQELRQLFAQLPRDVHRHIADKLSWTDWAKCLLLTKSGLERHGISVLFAELKEWHRLGQRLKRLKLPGHSQKGQHRQHSHLARIPHQGSFPARLVSLLKMLWNSMYSRCRNVCMIYARQWKIVKESFYLQTWF